MFKFDNSKTCLKSLQAILLLHIYRMLILFHGAETQLQGGINAKGTDCVASQLQEIHATALSTHIYQLTPGSTAYKMVQGM